MTTINKFVVYKRLSKEKKGTTQYGFDAQEFDLEYYFSNKENYEIVAEYQEFFSGGGSWTNRKELVKAVELCKEIGATLVVTKVDRLGRNTASVATLLETIPVVITSMPHAENMVIQILASVAEKERDMISARTKAALAVAKSKGVKLGAANEKYKRAEYSTTRNGKASQLHCFNLKETLITYRSLNMSYATIAQKLNERGVTTIRGKQFAAMSVSRICDKLQIK